MNHASFVLLLLGAAGGPAASPGPSADPGTLAVPADQLSQARELVQALGSDQFAEREQAERRLADLGRLARAALLEAASTDPSPEVRSRCHALLPRATTLEMRARVEVFLADAGGRYEHDLPGWNEFRSLARNEWSVLGYTLWSDRAADPAARVVFADLLSSRPNRTLLMAAATPGELGPLAAARRQELYSQKHPRQVFVGGTVQPRAEPRTPTAADLAALLFAESLAPSAGGGPRTSLTSSLLAGSPFVAAVQRGDDQARVYRAVAAAWLATRQDGVEMYNGLNVATSLGMTDEGCRLAARLLGSRGAVGSYRGMGAATLARSGNRSHLPLLERVLADDSVVYTARRNVINKDGKNEQVAHEVQARDVALAVSVLLTGQSLADYGFVDLYAAPAGGGATAFSYSRQYLPEAGRKAALEKWAEWRAKNP